MCDWTQGKSHGNQPIHLSALSPELGHVETRLEPILGPSLRRGLFLLVLAGAVLCSPLRADAPLIAPVLLLASLCFFARVALNSPIKPYVYIHTRTGEEHCVIHGAKCDEAALRAFEAALVKQIEKVSGGATANQALDGTA